MTPDEATQWRASLAEMRSDLTFRDKRRAIEEERRSVQPELTAFFSTFRDGTLSMEATARTYRYLDAAELEQVRAAADKKKQGGKKSGDRKAGGTK